MSTRRGANNKSGAQKHQNTSTWKNDLHKTSPQQKALNSLSVTGCCPRCREQLEWKIKYNKYKPLTQPKVCSRCSQRTIRAAYRTLCSPCAKAAHECDKCGETVGELPPPPITAAQKTQQDAELQVLMKQLTERRRRRFLRQIRAETWETVAEALTHLRSELTKCDAGEDSGDEESEEETAAGGESGDEKEVEEGSDG